MEEVEDNPFGDGSSEELDELFIPPVAWARKQAKRECRQILLGMPGRRGILPPLVDWRERYGELLGDFTAFLLSCYPTFRIVDSTQDGIEVVLRDRRYALPGPPPEYRPISGRVVEQRQPAHPYRIAPMWPLLASQVNRCPTCNTSCPTCSSNVLMSLAIRDGPSSSPGAGSTDFPPHEVPTQRGRRGTRERRRGS